MKGERSSLQNDTDGYTRKKMGMLGEDKRPEKVFDCKYVSSIPSAAKLKSEKYRVVYGFIYNNRRLNILYILKNKEQHLRR